MILASNFECGTEPPRPGRNKIILGNSNRSFQPRVAFTSSFETDCQNLFQCLLNCASECSTQHAWHSLHQPGTVMERVNEVHRIQRSERPRPSSDSLRQNRGFQHSCFWHSSSSTSETPSTLSVSESHSRSEAMGSAFWDNNTNLRPSQNPPHDRSKPRICCLTTGLDSRGQNRPNFGNATSLQSSVHDMNIPD